MKLTKVLKSSIPYILLFYLGNIFSSHVREYSGGDFIDRIAKAFTEIASISCFLSFDIYDLGIGILFAVIVKFVVYTKGKKRKNFRE